MKSVDVWYELEFADHVKDGVADRKFATDLKALEQVELYRRLDDPAFNPVAITKVTQTTVTERELHASLRVELDPERVFDKVMKRIREAEGTPSGEALLRWAVHTTLEESQ